MQARCQASAACAAQSAHLERSALLLFRLAAGPNARSDTALVALPATTQIFIKSDRTRVLEVEPTSSVAAVKAAAGVAGQRLVFAGRQLEDSCTLAQCGIKVRVCPQCVSVLGALRWRGCCAVEAWPMPRVDPAVPGGGPAAAAHTPPLPDKTSRVATTQSRSCPTARITSTHCACQGRQRQHAP